MIKFSGHNSSQTTGRRWIPGSHFLKLFFILISVTLCFANPAYAASSKPVSKTKTTKHHTTTAKKHHSTAKKTKSHTKLSKHKSKKTTSTTSKKRTKRSQPRVKVYKANTGKTNLDDDAQHRLVESNFKQPDSGFLTGMEKRLINFVHSTVDSLRYSVYKLGGRNFDATKGIYVLDCSTYVDNVIKAVFPDAYSNLVNASGTETPTSQHYYQFFNGLDEDGKGYWNKVEDIEALRPGDVIVFREKKNLHSVSGHVMVVVDKPIPTNNAFLIRVADSAPVGHSKDTRPPHTSGIGIGTLLLKENPRTGQPSAYAWKVGSYWKTNVNFAMARPNDAS